MGFLPPFISSWGCVIVLLSCLSEVCSGYYIVLFGRWSVGSDVRGCCLVGVFCDARWCGGTSSSFCLVPSVE
jgi:hypothetical protein